jgi:hypothetical protein
MKEKHMPTHTVTGYHETSWLIKGHNATFTLADKSTIHVWDNFCIGIDTPYKGNTLDVAGSVFTNSGEGVAIGIEADDTTVNIAATGEVVGNQGIISDGAATHVANNGLVHAFEEGVELGAKGRLVNRGDLFGGTGVSLADGTVENDKGAHLVGGDAAVLFTGNGDNKVVNHGLISSGLTAIDLGQSGGHIVNDGRIDGIVDLGDGGGTFDTRKGVLHGTAEGGLGDDTYMISSDDIRIEEGIGAGYDRIFSSVTFTLPDNVESLHLLGKADIDGHGNDLGVELVGNAGKNHLTGGAGGDQLGGGAGNDALKGGGGADDFNFFHGDGIDTILDYVDGEDRIFILGFDHVKSYAQLENHIHQHDNDVWITLGGDKVVVKHADAGAFDATDFFFQLN